MDTLEEDEARIPEDMWNQRVWEDQGEATREALEMIKERMLRWQKINMFGFSNLFLNWSY